MAVWGNATFEIKDVVDKNPSLYLKRAEIALKAGKYEEAADEIIHAEIYADGNNAVISQCVRIKTVLAKMGFISDLDVLKSLKQDADNSIPRAFLLLGIVYERGDLGEDADYKAAFEYYLKAVQLGVAEANYYIGTFYYFGLEVNRDYLKAHKYFLEAIKTENETTGLAFLKLGYMYLDGAGVKKHIQTAVKMFLKAVKYNECKGRAFYKLSECIDDERKKFRCIFESAKSGDAAGMFSLGYCYISGSGCKTDADKGFRLLKTMAGKDNEAAVIVCESLAKIYGGYDKEIGKAYMDIDKAVQYAKEAWESGSLNGADILGNLYLDNGNAELGLRILKDAAQKGNADAMCSYGFGLIEQGENEEGLSMLKQAYDCGEDDTKEFLKPYIDEMEKRENTNYKEDNEMNAEERAKRIIKMKEDIAVDKGLEITEGLIAEIMDKSNNMTMELAIYACARAMVQLASYQYIDWDRNGEIDKSFFEALERARFLAVTELVPCISKPMPCGECKACRNGEWEYCLNKKADKSLLQLSNIAMLSESLIDYIISTTTMVIEKNK